MTVLWPGAARWPAVLALLNSGLEREITNPPVQGLVDVLVLALWWDICLPGGASRDLAQSLLAEQMPIWQQRDAACPASNMLIPAARDAGDSRSRSCCIKPERSGRSQKGVIVLCRRP